MTSRIIILCSTILGVIGVLLLIRYGEFLIGWGA